MTRDIDADEPIRPTKIRLEASTYCQLRCPTCPTTTGETHAGIGGGFLKFEDFRALLDSAPWLEEIELSNYGEIFLNPDLPGILEHAHKCGVRLTARNGVNLNNATDEMLEALVKYRFEHLRCSLDGASNESYRQYRVRGNFDRVIGNIRKINAYKKQYGSDRP
ncbi:MAG: radical SAM protein, partial [Hyphomicrobiales bacterium]